VNHLKDKTFFLPKVREVSSEAPTAWVIANIQNHRPQKLYYTLMNKLFATLLLIICQQVTSNAQAPIQSKQYPKGYFRYPLDLPPSTAGGFGEIRPNHFHSGLDFRTNQRSGYPVYAAADGYISRLRIQYGGGGNIVYIDHPNGYTTVYMHNQSFSPQLARAIKDYQYKIQKYDIDFNLPANQIKVAKGDVIAISGQSGAVAGPHVHFEIRETKTEQTINPQLFGLTIPDQIAPAISTMAVYTLGSKPFSENTPHQFLPVSGSAGSYRLTQPKVLELSGAVGFGISVIDQNSASANRYGVYSIELKLDGNTVYTFTMERFGFDQTRAINGYIDYPTFLTTGRFIQKCFIPPGSRVSLYPQSINRGVINFTDDALHTVDYIVKDVAGNTSTLSVKVQSKSPPPPPPAVIKGPEAILRHNQRNEFNMDKIRVAIMPGNLYDDVVFTYATLPKKPGTYSATHRIHNRFTPIHDRYDIWIKPDQDLGALADKAVITGSMLCDSSYFDNGYVKARARAFGEYYIRVDTVPPVITPVNIHSGSDLSKTKKVFFRLSDNLTGIKSYNGRIDGKWVLMERDYKSKLLSYTFDDSIGTGKHTFELAVSDAKNNVSTFTAQFNR
jgi:murein DD-endopeptidase MepM/ murein hydrolase activator NlpD